MNVPNLAPGTYYIKVGNYSGAGNYTISTTFTYSYYPSDLEPNNYMIQAIEIQPTDTTMGILGYIGQNYQDYNDWYKITLLEDGSLTLRVLTYQSLTVNTLYLFDSDTTTIISSGNWGTDAVVEFPNLAAGNYFVKVPRYTGYGSYYITSTFTPAAFTNDMEPNNIPQNSIFL